MNCFYCQSQNILPLKEGEFFTGIFCYECGNGRIDYTQGSCCDNQLLINIRFEQTNGTIVQRVACKNCKTLSGGAKKKGPDFDKLPLLTQKRYLQIESDKNRARKNLQDFITTLSNNFKEDKQKQWWEKYSAYLKTDKWKHKRALVLQRENEMCQGCNYAKAVHVHHTTYDNLGDELLFQLVALCVQCHNKLHPEKTL